MKYLTLVRHAKSSWADLTMGDHERTLNERGQKNAPVMGRFLANTYFGADGSDALLPWPTRFVVSSAVRTMETANLMAEPLQINPDSFIREPRAYLASPETLLDIVNGFQDDWEHVMLFSHNNGISDFVNKILIRGNIGDMPTCSVVIVELPHNEWVAAGFGQGRLVGYITPKLIEKRFSDAATSDSINSVDISD